MATPTEASIIRYEIRKLRNKPQSLASLASPYRIKNWSPLDGLDPFRAGCQHYKPVETKRGATCVRHIDEGCEEILVDGIGDAENALLFFHAFGKSSPLFIRITQLMESIC